MDYKKKYLKYKKKYLNTKKLYGGAEEEDDKIFNTKLLMDKLGSKKYHDKEIYTLLNSISDKIKEGGQENNLYNFIKKLYDTKNDDIGEYLYSYQEDPSKLRPFIFKEVPVIKPVGKKRKRQDIENLDDIRNKFSCPFPNPATFIAESLTVLKKAEEEEKSCPYGKDCYRLKNPDHMQKMRHPCPYGEKCYRKDNPEHIQMYSHS